MAKPILTKEEKHLKELEIQAERDEKFHLVTKIISWKTGCYDSNCVQNNEKITKAEWQKYEKHLFDIYKTEDVKDVKEKLKNIFSAIQSNHGFE